MTINKSQLQQHFPDATDADAQKASSDPDGFARDYAQRTGQDENTVRQQVQSLSQGNQGGQSQGQGNQPRR